MKNKCKHASGISFILASQHQHSRSRKGAVMSRIHSALAHEAVMKLSQRRSQKGIRVQFTSGIWGIQEKKNVEVGDMISRKKNQCT